MNKLKVTKLDPAAIAPYRATRGAAGYDLHNLSEVTIPPWDRKLIPTGLALKIPRGYYGRIAPRSSLAHQLKIDVAAGVIDPDYRGHIHILLVNNGPTAVTLPRNSRMAQVILEKIITPHVQVQEFPIMSHRGRRQHLNYLRISREIRRPSLESRVSQATEISTVPQTHPSTRSPTPLEPTGSENAANPSPRMGGFGSTGLGTMLTVLAILCIPLIAANEENTQNGRATFINHGWIANEVTTFNIIGRMNITQFEKDIDQLQSILKNWSKVIIDDQHMEKNQKKVMKGQVAILTMEVQNAKKQMRIFSYGQKRSLVPTRSKRSFDLLPGIGVIGAIGNLIFNVHLNNKINDIIENQAIYNKITDVAVEEIQKNSEHIEKLKNKVYELIDRQNHFTERLNATRWNTRRTQYVMSWIQTADILTASIASRTKKLINIWEDALHGRSTTDMFDPTQVRNMLKKAKDNIGNGLVLATDNNPADFYRMQSNAVMSDKEMRIIVPIPLYNIRTMLELLQWIDTDQITKEGYLFRIKPESKYVATNPEKTLYRKINDEELQRCLRVNRLFLCPNMRVLHKMTKESCLSAILSRKPTMIWENCDHQLIRDNDTRINQIGDHQFISTGIQNTEFLVKCENKTTTTKKLVSKGIQTFELAEGCTATSSKIHITATRNNTLHENQVLLPLNLGPRLSLRDIIATKFDDTTMDDDTIKSITKDLWNEDKSVSLSQVVERWKMNRNPVHPTQWIIITLIIILVLCSISVILYLYRRYKKNSVEERDTFERAYPLNPIYQQ